MDETTVLTVETTDVPLSTPATSYLLGNYLWAKL